MHLSMLKRLMVCCKALVVLALLGSSNLQASTPVPPFQMSIGVSTPEVIYGKVKISNPGPPVRFETHILPNFVTAGQKFDIYFGGVSPARRVFSWVPAAGSSGTTVSLVEGLIPLGKSVAIDGPTTQSDLLGGGKITHQFSARDQEGMYFLFSFVVREGADPTETDNWIVQDSMYFAILP